MQDLTPGPGPDRTASDPGTASAPLDSDIRRYLNLKHKSKAERNQNIANAFYQGGHTQTAIALAFDVSGSTVSRVIKEFENGG